ncbi:MAG TPA: Hsp20/alpha crystallin family protein [Acidimicrobiales bacterium]|jgi:HSP20 family molecular chaperone IbpA|nr:Hsp20/alpha crystallin family protein [Acidimicrobiales bacterium]
MSDQPVPKVVRAEPVETDDGVVQRSQEPSGPGNRDGGGEWPDPDTPPEGLVEYDPQRVPVNMYETEGALVLVLPLPGVMADDVTIDIDGTRVQVQATQRTAAEKDYIAHEWHYGPYERMVSVPPGFDGPAFATFGNGQLAVHLERGEGRGARVVVRPSAAGHPGHEGSQP